MTAIRGYLLYGCLILGLLGAAEYRGWSPLSPNDILLSVPPAALLLRNMSFEHARWQESDYAGGDDE